jgi:uncharacterized protein (DUF924 family)
VCTFHSAEFGEDFDQYRSERLSRQDDGAYASLTHTPAGSLALATLNYAVPRAQLRGAVRANGGKLTPELAVSSWLGPRGVMLHDLFLQSNYAAMQELHPLAFDSIERQFYYLPLLRSERLNTVKVAVARINELHDNSPRVHRPYLTVLADHAKEHVDLLQRFGRFPHRNAVTGRVSTPEELAWMASPEAPALEPVSIHIPSANARKTARPGADASAGAAANARRAEARVYAARATHAEAVEEAAAAAAARAAAEAEDETDARMDADEDGEPSAQDLERYRQMMAKLPPDLSAERRAEAEQMLGRMFERIAEAKAADEQALAHERAAAAAAAAAGGSV